MMTIRMMLRDRLPQIGVLLSMVVFLTGCDSVYHYVVYPPPHIEQILVPDIEWIKSQGDSSFSVSRDSLTLIYDRKDYKIEIKYLSDMQLNQYDFADLSTSGLLSGNPYTNSNWIDPKLGYTPQRFTNFKIAIYNYSSSKINIDPENSAMETDRGDISFPYGRERLKSRYHSFEEYFQRLKGAAGSDEELYETRMGVIRRTSFILSRPLYAGDNRDGMVTYDPLEQTVERVKLSFNKVILGYDENNEPDRFIDVVFYFKRVPLRPISSAQPVIASRDSQKTKAADSSKTSIGSLAALSQGLNLTLLEHKFVQSARIDARETSYWNPLPTAIPNLLARFTQVTNVKASYSTILPTQGTLDNAHVMFLACGKETPVFNDVMIEAITEAMKKKTFLIIDDGYERKDREFVYENFTKEFLEKIGKQLSDSYRLEQVSPGHALYGDLSSTAQQSIPKSSTVMLGLTVTGELVAVGVMNSLYQKWEGSANMTPELREEALRLGTNLLIYGGSKKSSVERE